MRSSRPASTSMNVIWLPRSDSARHRSRTSPSENVALPAPITPSLTRLGTGTPSCRGHPTRFRRPTPRAGRPDRRGAVASRVGDAGPVWASRVDGAAAAWDGAVDGVAVVRRVLAATLACDEADLQAESVRVVPD